VVDRGDHSLIQKRGTPVSAEVLDDVVDWMRRVLPGSSAV
jgi:hypothetical protein